MNNKRYTVGNGITESSTPTGTRSTNASDVFMIGNISTGVKAFDGLIDNPALSDKTRPSSHTITSYNAEKSDSDTVNTGTEVIQWP